MQGGRRGRDNFLGQGDPFADFGGFGRQGSLISSAFGGRDPFDDPFFTRPFGGSPFGGMLEPSFFGAGGSPFRGGPAGFFERQQPMPQGHPQNNRHRDPIIEELDSDNESPEDGAANYRGSNSRMHGMSGNVVHIEHPDDAAGGWSNRDMQMRSEHNRRNVLSRPQSQSFSFSSSSVTYGGANGAYYTKSSTKRSGSDGVTYEEHKEADSNSGKAYHQVSRGLHDKGHTLTRNLNPDGKVDAMQTLHNLNEDELGGFEEAWKGNAGKYLPGVSERFSGYDNSAKLELQKVGILQGLLSASLEPGVSSATTSLSFGQGGEWQRRIAEGASFDRRSAQTLWEKSMKVLH